MKKPTLFRIIIILVIIIVILLLTTLFYRLYQVKNFQNDLRSITEAEKQQVIDILNNNFDIRGYEINIGNVYIKGNERLVRVQLKKDVLNKNYIINLNNNSLVINKNEK
jgi:hypothetical protein